MPDTENTSAQANDTNNSGQSASADGNTNQDAITKLEQTLAELSNKNKELEAAHKSVQAESMRWQSSYRSLQSNTTASLQEAARLRQEQAMQQRLHDEIAQSRAELAQVRDGLAFLVGRMGDEEAGKEFQLRQREMQLKQAEELTAARIKALQTQQPPPQPISTPVDLDLQKRDFLEFYFPGSGIDYTDPGLDWGESAPDTREAFRRFTTSVMKLRDGTAKKADVNEVMVQWQKERDELSKSHSQALEELRIQTRREIETSLRKMGADTGNGPATPTSATKTRTELNELDESALQTGEPGQRAKAARDMEKSLRGMRDRLIRQQ